MKVIIGEKMVRNTLNVNLDVSGEPCLVVGGGGVAERKAKQLHGSGANLMVVSPEFTDRSIEFLEAEGIEYLEEEFTERHLDGKTLAVAATSDREVNRRVSQAAQERGVLVNVVDDKDISTFTLTAAFDRGDLKVAVSTGGASPALSASVKQRLHDGFGPAYEKYLDILKRLRPEIISRMPEEDRRELLIRLGDQRVEKALWQGDLKEALDFAEKTVPKELKKIFIEILEEVGVDSDGKVKDRY